MTLSVVILNSAWSSLRIFAAVVAKFLPSRTLAVEEATIVGAKLGALLTEAKLF